MFYPQFITLAKNLSYMIKKFTFALILCFTTGLAFSQSMLNKITSAASNVATSASTAATTTATSTAASSGLSLSSLPSLSNVTQAKTGIMSKLTSALALTQAQKPTVTSAIGSFLQQKAAIMPTVSTAPATYSSKFSALQSGLFTKLKTALTAAQFSSLLGLKPAAPSATNVLSSLFF